MDHCILKTPIGAVRVDMTEDTLYHVELLYDASVRARAPKPWMQPLCNTITQYFHESTTSFDINIHYEEYTPLQVRIWQAIAAIPHGQVCTYSELAATVGTHPRVIGNACHANPTPIVVPCHRVVAKSGIGGFSGHRDGVQIQAKNWLLEHENALTH